MKPVRWFALLVFTTAAAADGPAAAAPAPATVVDVAIGRDGSCAVTSAGEVRCWRVEQVTVGGEGYARVAKPTIRAGLGTMTKVAVGSAFGCALNEGGEAFCWGKNDTGQRGAGSARGEYPADMPDAGEGRVTKVAGGHHFVDLLAATWHVCGITKAGQVACWGSNYRKQTGGDGYATATPHLVAGPSGVAELALGEYYSCARSRAGKVWCWGDPFSRGEEAADPKPALVAVPRATLIAGDDYGACALDAQGKLWCWGYSDDLVASAPEDRKPVLVPTPGKVKAIGAGGGVVLDDGRVRCAGRTGAALSREAEATVGKWVALPGVSDVHALTVRGGSHGCAITEAGELSCFGYRDQLGLGLEDEVTDPVTVVGLSDVRQLAVDASSCALRADGAVWCWGGNDNNDARPAPVVGLPGKVVSVSTGGGRACALLDDGRVSCWERGTGPRHQPPTLVAGIDSARALSVGPAHACAIVTGGKVTCWGKNYRGELGVLPTTEYPPPRGAELVPGVSGASAIACGACSTCASDATGVWCWGCNEDGQLGNGTLQEMAVPERVVGVGASAELSVGIEVACARETGGELRCWGQGALTAIPWRAESPFRGASAGSGRACAVSDAGTVTCGLPGAATPVAGLVDVTSVGVGYKHACALSKDGTVRCWGDRSGGVLGDGVPDFVVEAVAPAW